MKTLLFLTNSFPYDSGEEFIESELPVLESSFDQVIIIANEITRTSKITRNTGENTVVVKLKNINTSVFKVLVFLYYGILAMKYRWIRLGIIESPNFLLGIRSLLQAGREYRKYKHILTEMESYYNDAAAADNELYLYTYWFVKLPLIASFIYEDTKYGKLVKQFVSRAHGYDLYLERSSIGYFPFRQQILEKISAVYVCSEMGMKYLQHQYPNHKHKIKVSKLGTIDQGLFPVPPPLTKQSLKLISCSSLIPLKRVHLIMEALLAAEERQLFDFEWTHIGGTGEKLQEYRDKARKKIKRNKVVFTGHLPNKDIFKFYKSHEFHFFISTSSSEGLPVSMMEVISGGIPCIATDVGGVKEIVFDEINGFLLQHNLTSDNLLQTLQRVIGLDHKDYLELRANARKVWEQGFNAINNYTNYAKNIL